MWCLTYVAILYVLAGKPFACIRFSFCWIFSILFHCHWPLAFWILLQTTYSLWFVRNKVINIQNACIFLFLLLFTFKDLRSFISHCLCYSWLQQNWNPNTQWDYKPLHTTRDMWTDINQWSCLENLQNLIKSGVLAVFSFWFITFGHSCFCFKDRMQNLGLSYTWSNLNPWLVCSCLQIADLYWDCLTIQIIVKFSGSLGLYLACLFTMTNPVHTFKPQILTGEMVWNTWTALQTIWLRILFMWGVEFIASLYMQK